jgi:CDP-glycerol glycerophosphotransferase (TagB/SpsB family)
MGRTSFYLKLRTAVMILRSKSLFDSLRQIISEFDFPYKPFSFLIEVADGYAETDSNLVLLGSNRGYEGNSRYLYEYLLKNTQIDAVWVAHDQTVVDRLESRGKPVVNSRSLEGIRALLNANVAIINHDFADVAVHPSFVPSSVTSIFISHGARLPRERHLPDEPQNDDIEYDYFACYSELHRKFSIWLDGRTGKTDLENVPDSIEGRFQITGSPKTDLLMNPTDAMLDKWDRFIGDNDPESVILYAPVKGYIDKPADLNEPIHDFFPFEDFDREALYDYLTETDSLLLIRPHPVNVNQMRKYPCGPFELLKDDLDELCAGSDRVRLATHETFSTIELLPFVDVLLTNWSTIFFEYLPLDRNIVFIDKGCYDESARPNFKFDFESYKPGPTVTNQAQLLKELEKAADETDEFAAERREVRERFYKYGDQKATSRVAELVEEIL